MTTPAAFKDYFSGHSDAYERYRPHYPPALYAWLAGQAPARRLAVDVATGNGQAALGLAEHFDAVVALEPSPEQLRQARDHARVEYRQASAEAMPLAADSADLLVAAQAAHWFDWQAFIAGARRILKPGGILAIWCYGLFECDPTVDRLVQEFSRDVVGPWWPRERRHVEEGYRKLVPPFPALDVPGFEMQADWDFDAVLGYLGTWSAVRRAQARTRRNPLDLLEAPLRSAWGAGARRVRWPLVLRVHRCR
jgi:SAM-dependent methyltransferase